MQIKTEREQEEGMRWERKGGGGEGGEKDDARK